MKRQRGFTLIEFFIVLAIIGIFAALAAPSIRRISQNHDCQRTFDFSLETMLDKKARPVVSGAIAQTFERMDKDIADAFTKEGELRKTPVLPDQAAQSLSEANALNERQRLLGLRREAAKALLSELGIAAP